MGDRAAERRAAAGVAYRRRGGYVLPSAVDRSRVWNAQEYFDALV